MQTLRKYERADFIAVEVARRLSEEYSEAFYVAVGKHGSWDLRSESGKTIVEIKCESTPVRTNNIAIEYFNTELNQPSGVSATSATLWIHLVQRNEGWVALEYDIHVLRQLVAEKGTARRCGYNSLCKIIPLSEAESYAKRKYPFESRFLKEDNLVRGEIPIIR